MKKMTFALACASAVAAFAWEAPVLNAIGFDEYALTDGSFKGLSNKKDNGTEATASGDSFWLYLGASSGSEDGSTVKAYDPEKTGNPNYLELSTEGGTLWRSISGLSSATTLGSAQAVPAGGLYIDTLVQFTPTEDGGAPTLDEADKLAIWLNVDKDGVTNLCVLAMQVAGESIESLVPTEKTFVLNNAEGNLAINAGEWHKLVVKSTLLKEAAVAFEIFVDGVQLKAVGTEKPWSSAAAGLWGVSATAADGVFMNLLYVDGSCTTLQAVGFKGSGAIDSLQFTTQDPGGETPEPAATVNLTISVDHATVTGITEGKVEVGSNLTFTVTAETGYKVTGVTINNKTVTADAGNYTYKVTADDTAVAVVVTTEAINWDNPDTSAGTTAGAMFKLTGPIAAADGATVAKWAKKYSVNFADASTIKVEAFLLNCANEDDAITTAKADFKIPSITIGADGTVTVASPDPDGSKYNGVITIKGSKTVEGDAKGDYTLEKVDGKFPKEARFFKAYLSVE